MAALVVTPATSTRPAQAIRLRQPAVAIILAPLAYQVAKETGADPKPFMAGLAICVSAAFCTPIAYESTILVMGPGRYEFKHYLQVGGVMAFPTWLVATIACVQRLLLKKKPPPPSKSTTTTMISRVSVDIAKP